MVSEYTILPLAGLKILLTVSFDHMTFLHTTGTMLNVVLILGYSLKN